MSGQNSPVTLIISLVAGNVLYLIFTVVLSMILGVAPTDIFSGPMAGAANSLVSAWKAAGVLLGVADLVVVFGFVSSVLDSGR
jgi:hypothetical protein